MCIRDSNRAVKPAKSKWRARRLAECKILASQTRNAACSRLSTAQFATGPKRSMGHVLGAGKGNFLIRDRGRPTVYGGRACGIQSIPAQEVSLGSPWVVLDMGQSPTPHAQPLPLVDIYGNSLSQASHLPMICQSFGSELSGELQVRAHAA